MQVGTVVRWRHFSDPQYGGVEKPRWFLCLGNTGKIIKPTLCYLHSTTTTKRTNIPCFSFSTSKYPFFRENCFLYYNERPYCCAEKELISIEKGRIMDALQIIYELQTLIINLCDNNTILPFL